MRGPDMLQFNSSRHNTVAPLAMVHALTLKLLYIYLGLSYASHHINSILSLVRHGKHSHSNDSNGRRNPTGNTSQ